MKRICQLALIVLVLGLTACGGSGPADRSRPDDNSESSRQAGRETPVREGGRRDAASAQPEGDFLRLSEVRIGPEGLFADVDLNAEAVAAPPVPDNVEYEYRWYVGNQLLADAGGPVLKSGNFRKHQWIICEARALAGGKSSVWLKSDWVRIADSPPQVESVAAGSFSIPGRFTYQISASDADKDELAYELVAPLDLGINLDRKTGLLTWDIDQAGAEKLGETLEISLSVSDNDAPPTTGSLTLRFQKRTEKRNP